MFYGRRRLAFPSEFVTRVALAWAVISALLVAINWGAISALRFPDPDDTLRLVQVRDLLGGQSWFDLTQYRADAPGGGVLMHWSRLVDLPLFLVIGALTPVFGSETAEVIALVLVPLITLGCAMLLAARIAWRLMGEEETNFTALIVALSVPVLAQLAPLRIDHHGWQLVCILAALNGLMARTPILGGNIIGASLAALIAISVEGLPLSVVFFAVLALRWLRNPAERGWLLGAIQALAVVSAFLFVATRGVSDLAVHCDAISPVHLAIFGWGALALSFLSRLEPLPIGARIAGFAVTGLGAGVFVGFGAPQCATGGGFAALDPLVHDFWYIHIMEGMPVWMQKLDVALQYAVVPFIGLYAAIALMRQSTDWLRGFWRDYALVLGGATVVALLVARAGAAACLIAAPPLAWQLNRWLRALRRMERPLPRVAGMVGVACALMPTLPLTVSELLVPAIFAQGAAQTGSQNATKSAQLAQVEAVNHLKWSDCKIDASSDILNALAPGEAFVPLHTAPQFLAYSHHSVVATGHHRGSPAMKQVLEISMGSAEEARAIMAARGTRYVAVCPFLIEPNNYAHAAPDGFMADLVHDRAPDWLEPVEAAEGTTLKIWRIVG
ncbi:MAG: hypothetical protein AAF291_13410 [Pseudomonadota bacterium]